MPGDQSKLWHFAQGEDSKGPFNEEEFARLIASGEVGPETRVWHDGLAGWMTLKELHEVRSAGPGASSAARPWSPTSSVFGPVRGTAYREPDPTGAAAAPSQSLGAHKATPRWRRLVVLSLVVVGALVMAFVVTATIVKRENEPAQSKPVTAPPSVNAAPAETTQESAEVEVESRVWTATNDAPVCFSRTINEPVGCNFNITHLHVTKNLDEGTLTIVFDYEDPNFVPFRFLVRLFDRNGNYLTHFVTAENFELWGHANTTGHKTLQYTVAIRDLRDAEVVEFGATNQR